MSTITKDKNLSITKSNQLSTASYYLTSEEQRLILACIGQINPMDPNGIDPLKKYIVTAEEFKALFKNNKNVNIYQILKQVSDKLYNRSLTIDSGSEIIKSRWVSEVGYAKNEGYISLIFAPLVVDHICRLKKNFNSYRLSNVQKMESIYGLRIYELIMSLEGTSYKRTFKVEDLKKMLGIENKYKMFADFKKKVLIPAQNDINSYSDINMEWELIKKSRKVEAVRLLFKEKPDSEKPKKVTIEKEEKITSSISTIQEYDASVDHDLEEWFNEDIEVNI